MRGELRDGGAPQRSGAGERRSERAHLIRGHWPRIFGSEVERLGIEIRRHPLAALGFDVDILRQQVEETCASPPPRSPVCREARRRCAGSIPDEHANEPFNFTPGIEAAGFEEVNAERIRSRAIRRLCQPSRQSGARSTMRSQYRAAAWLSRRSSATVASPSSATADCGAKAQQFLRIFAHIFQIVHFGAHRDQVRERLFGIRAPTPARSHTRFRLRRNGAATAAPPLSQTAPDPARRRPD